MIDWNKATILEGENVKLIPLSKEHREELFIAASDGKLWQLWFTSVPSVLTIDAYIEHAIQQQSDKQSLPFAVIDKSYNKIIGTTRYCNIDLTNSRLEIGYTLVCQTISENRSKH